ncbi:MAG: uracil-DNA glycosylase [Candidatus Bathyarchaeota archaeon]|nr:uracil-DNA glycosylase [Candidatus Bathyarchaeota archaeon]
MFTSSDSGKLTEMERLRGDAAQCTRCSLCETRINVVVGSGNLDSDIVLVGEAPGRKEDESGLPFVGSAGKLLDELLGGAGLDRADICIMNIIKCRPPKNRRPKKAEVRACESYLENQLKIMKPRIVAPMGNSALAYFFDRFNLGKAVVGDVHGERYVIEAPWGEITMIPLYHPAAAIYNRSLMDELKEDMKKIAGL